MTDTKPSINYVIATYAGVSKKRETSDKGITPLVLQMHLDKLIEFIPSTSMISQVTIIRPNVIDSDSYSEYYQIEEKVDIIQNQYNIPVKFVNMENHATGVSYSQYRKAFQKYPNFDFYILMEDDWVPCQPCFDELLLSEWKNQFSTIRCNAYLCLWYTAIMRYKKHAAISVGLISQKALSELRKCCKMDVQLDQYNFSLALQRLGTKINDFSDHGSKWRILFWETSKGVVYDFSDTECNKECLLAPLQYILMDKYEYEIVPRPRFC